MKERSSTASEDADLAAGASGKVRLRRDITLPYAVFILISGVVGLGIFVTPVAILRHCGSPGLSLVMWVAAGAVVMATALSYAELAALIPKAGGEYQYLKEVMGDVFGFLFGWMHLVMLTPGDCAIMGMLVAQYLLQPFYLGCRPPDAAVKLLTLLVVVSLIGLNCTKVKTVAKAASVFAVAKLMAMGLLVGGAIYTISQGKEEDMTNLFENTNNNFTSVAMSFLSAFYSYGGWQYVFSLAEELKKPERNGPLAAVISLIGVTIVYLLLNVCYFLVLNPEEVLQSETIAVTFAAKCLGLLAPAMPVCVALCTLGSLNGSLLCSNRIPFAVARDGMLPKIFSYLNVNHMTPVASLLFVGCLSIVYTLAGDAIMLIEYVSFGARISTHFVLYSVLYLRWTKPDLHRPIKVNLALPIIAMVANLSIILLSVYNEPLKMGQGVLLYLSGLPFFFIGRVLRKRKLSKLSGFSKQLQKALLLAPSE